MTDLERLQKKDEALHVFQRALLHINGMPDDVGGGSVGADAIFMRDSGTLREVADRLTSFRKKNGSYKVEGYSMYASDRLQVTYKFENGLVVHFYAKDYENALDVLSGGKCKIVREHVTPTPCDPYDTVRVECPL